MAIEKLSGLDHNRKDDEQLMRMLVDYVKYSSIALTSMHQDLMEEGIYNQFVVPYWNTTGGVVTNQTYQHTLYRASEDEALIVSFRVPEDYRYWMIQAGDLLPQTIDYFRHQASLNGHVDRADADGVTRVVLSKKDTGVENWIDLADVSHGYLLMRWLGCGEPSTPTIDQIPFAEIG